MSAPAPVIRIDSPAQALFVSDMHLDDHDPALCRRFFAAKSRFPV